MEAPGCLLGFMEFFWIWLEGMISSGNDTLPADQQPYDDGALALDADSDYTG